MARPFVVVAVRAGPLRIAEACVVGHATAAVIADGVFGGGNTVAGAGKLGFAIGAEIAGKATATVLTGADAVARAGQRVAGNRIYAGI